MCTAGLLEWENYTWSSDRTGEIFFHTSCNRRFFPSVGTHVRGQDAGSGKSFSTFLTTKRFFSSVCSHVLGQCAGLGKSFSTLLATKRFFSSVCSHVLGHVAGLGKSFSPSASSSFPGHVRPYPILATCLVTSADVW